MFSFLSMIGDYEQRKVSRYDDENGKGFVSTAKVTDSSDPYETGIYYKPWGSGVVIVQTYNNKETAQLGHDTYVKLFKNGMLPPNKPIDMGTNQWAELRRKLEE